MGKKTFDFAKVEIMNVEGRPMNTDLLKSEICNKLYVQGQTITESELGQKLWHADGDTELTEEEEKILRKEFEASPSYLIRKALLKQLD